jgi:hypothetical protein
MQQYRLQRAIIISGNSVTMPVHALRVHGLGAKSRRDSGVNAARLNAFPIWA